VAPDRAAVCSRLRHRRWCAGSRDPRPEL